MIGKLRAAAFVVWFYGITLAFCLLGVPVRIFARHRALWVARTWVKTVLAGMPAVLGVRVVVTGLHHLPASGAALIASQHQSEFDTLVWLKLMVLPSYVMKQELLRIPLFGALLKPAGMIPVDRQGGAAAMRLLLTETAAAAAAGRQIVIFPEGTRLPPGQRVDLQPGIAAIAARTGLSVIPVATDSGSIWTRKLMSRRSGDLHVAIGPPIPASTPRRAMLTAIEAFWREMERTGFQPTEQIGSEPVDNPVDDVSRQQSAGAPT